VKPVPSEKLLSPKAFINSLLWKSLKKRIFHQKSPKDEDLGLTGEATASLKEAMTENKRLKPLSDEPESEKPNIMRCDYCGRILSRSEVRWLKVHSYELTPPF